MEDPGFAASRSWTIAVYDVDIGLFRTCRAVVC